MRNRSARQGRQTVRRPLYLVPLAYLVILALLVLLAPVILPYGFNDADTSAIGQGYSWQHWLGTDELGRDVLTRLLWGGRVSFSSMLVAVGIACVIGIPLGIVSGYFGGWSDVVIMRITDTMLAFPALVLAIAVTAVLGVGTITVMVGVGIALAPSFARLMRAQVMAVKHRLYVDAATTMGRPRVAIVFRHIVPNAIQPVLVLGAHMLGVVLLLEASLSFLGLGTPPPAPSWGSMLRSAVRYAEPLGPQVLAPGFVIATVLLSINLVGDHVRDRLDPRAHTDRQ